LCVSDLDDDEDADEEEEEEEEDADEEEEDEDEDEDEDEEDDTDDALEGADDAKSSTDFKDAARLDLGISNDPRADARNFSSSLFVSALLSESEDDAEDSSTIISS
jgi:hypothetical protein